MSKFWFLILSIIYFFELMFLFKFMVKTSNCILLITTSLIFEYIINKSF